MVSKSAVFLVFSPKLSSASRYAWEETHISHLVPTRWLVLKHFCNTPYLPVDTHSYAYAHGLHEQCVPKSPKVL